VIALTLSEPPAGTTHWSARRLGERLGMSKTTVWRIWRSAGLKFHRTETFNFSTDPDLEAKVRDAVGLYLAPPERAIALSVDEKTQVQADPSGPAFWLPGGKPGRTTGETSPMSRNAGRNGSGWRDVELLRRARSRAGAPAR